MAVKYIEVPYGDQELKVKISDANLAGTIVANDVPIGDEDETLKHAIEHPLQSKSLGDFLKATEDVLFIVNDATRPTPTTKVLESVFQIIKPQNPQFIVATGTHRAPTEKEYYQIFGRFYDEYRPHVYAHNSRADQEMVYIGTSRIGTKLEVNKRVMAASKLIIISSVEPHYFAGYTGGRKSFFPGVASYKSIEQNHRHSMDPDAKILALTGNPVHEDMIDAMKSLKDKEIFSIMTVLDKDHRVYAATAGDINESFRAAAKKADEVFIVRIPEKADIVITIAKFPMDIDFYQSVKAVDNAKLALKDKGIIILVSSCRAGTGDTGFIKLMSSCSTPSEVFNHIKEGYVVGYHKAAKLAEIYSWAEIYGVTNLPDELLKSMFIQPFNSLQEALDESIQKKGQNARVLFMMDGGMTVPVV
jgi:lactate racemase